MVSDPDIANYFEEAASELREQAPAAQAATLYHYLTSDLRGLMNEAGTTFPELKIMPEHLAHLVTLIEEKKITSRQAKDVLAKMFVTGADATEIVKNEGIGVSSDEGEIEAVVAEVIKTNPAAVADYKKGKTASLQFLIGKGMAALKGRAEPGMLKEIFIKLLQ